MMERMNSENPGRLMVLQEIYQEETPLIISMVTAPAPLKSQPLHNFSFSSLSRRKNQMISHYCLKSNVGTVRESPLPLLKAESDSASLPSCSSTFPHLEKSQKNHAQTVSASEVSSVKKVTSNTKFLIRLRPGKKPELVLKNNPTVVLNAGHEGGQCEIEKSITKPGNMIPGRVVISKAVNNIGKASQNAESQKKLLSQPVPLPEKRSLRLKGIAATQNEKKKKRKLSTSLSREEIEEDFFAVTGSKLARRPKKRAKNVQEQVDHIFPGLCFDGITPDSYMKNYGL